MASAPRLSDATPEALLSALRRDGFVVVRDAVPQGTLDSLDADLHARLPSIPHGRNFFEGFKTRRVYNLFSVTRHLDALVTNPVLQEVLQELLGGSEILLSSTVGIQIMPGEKGQMTHRDQDKYPCQMSRGHQDQQLCVNMVLAVDEFTESNGATRYYPGSHTWQGPPTPDRVPPGAEQVPALLPRGSVLLWLGSLWHGGGANSTEAPRMGVLLEFIQGFLRPQENHLLGVRPEVVAGLDPALQGMLGYNVYPPFVGHVDGRHPRKLLPGGSQARL